jgi:hypothetical protein
MPKATYSAQPADGRLTAPTHIVLADRRFHPCGESTVVENCRTFPTNDRRGPARDNAAKPGIEGLASKPSCEAWLFALLLGLSDAAATWECRASSHCIPATARIVVSTIDLMSWLPSRSVSIRSSSVWVRSLLPTPGRVIAGMPRLIGMLESVELHS